MILTTQLLACTSLQIVGESDMVYGVAHSHRVSRVYAIQRTDALQFVQVVVTAGCAKKCCVKDAQLYVFFCLFCLSIQQCLRPSDSSSAFNLGAEFTYSIRLCLLLPRA
jgi:hypothetical protein